MDDLRSHIVKEVQRMTNLAGGSPPGWRTFNNHTGIAISKWRGIFWAKWSEALLEAGYQPNLANEKIGNADFLIWIARSVLHFKKFPSQPELNMYLREQAEAPSLRALRNRYATKGEMVSALTELATKNHAFSKLTEYIAEEKTETISSTSRNSYGWVYLIQSGKHFKIGRSDTLERRIKQISITLPENVVLVHAIETDDSAGIELYWHRRFADLRANGEWFALSKADIAAFKKRKFM